MTKAKYNFVINCTDDELDELKNIRSLAEYIDINPKKAASIFKRGDLSWCLQTYLILLQRNNLPVFCSNKLRKRHINIVPTDFLLNIKGTDTDFIVCVQSDFPRRSWPHFHIVQNKNQVMANTSYIPHWFQPGLIKRDSNRQGVRRVAYSGQTWNGNLAGNVESWKALFEPHNIEFKPMPAENWHDMSSIDVLVGVRSFDTKPHNRKPPTKLLNAWHSNIPFIGGYDSAYDQVGTPGEDYLRVKSQEETIEAVLELKNNPDLYNKLVENGKKRAEEYTEQKIAECWEKVLANDIFKRYQQWNNRPLIEIARFRSMLGIGMLQHQSKQLVKRILNFV